MRRIQPNEETRHKQLLLWKNLVLLYCEATKVSLFHQGAAARERDSLWQARV
jgi:ESCRT-II complex subunit